MILSYPYFFKQLQCQTLNSNAYLVEIADAEENTVVYRISSYSGEYLVIPTGTTGTEHQV